MTHDEEIALHAARQAHLSDLIPGVRVRMTRGRTAGLEGDVIGSDPDNATRITVRDDDGIRWSCEPAHLEIVAR